MEKPARYIGGEYNMQVKDQADLRFALCFPDVYEIGMSHLGSRILYHVLNAMDGVRCERCFAPWTDMEQALREAGEELFTLETRSPLKSFDIVGFSLLYEMCYSNILTMLALSHIPFLSRDRGEDMPLLVAGGPCAVNPEPIAPFFDAVVIGDGEEAEPELVNAYRAWRAAGGRPSSSCWSDWPPSPGSTCPASTRRRTTTKTALRPSVASRTRPPRR